MIEKMLKNGRAAAARCKIIDVRYEAMISKIEKNDNDFLIKNTLLIISQSLELSYILQETQFANDMIRLEHDLDEKSKCREMHK